MCQSSKSLSQASGERGIPRLLESGTSTLRIQRQESVVMENLRQLEERDALEKWERIVRYCKEVKSINLDHIVGIRNAKLLMRFNSSFIYLIDKRTVRR